MFKAILFDFNGLIVDDEPIHFECFKRVLLDEEIDLTEEAYWKDYLGFDDKGLFEAVFSDNQKKITPKKLADLIRKKNDVYIPIIEQKLPLFPGVDSFIREVAKTYDMAVVSGALRNEIDCVLKAGKLDSYFPIIISANDTKRGKPDPEGFVMGLTRLKKKNPEVRPENCLVLEDSHAGIEAAHRAGMKVVALPHSYPKEELSGKADFVAADFDEVLDFIRRA